MPPSLLIPDADVRALRCDRSASGYVNVYPHEVDSRGVLVYVARVKRDGRLVNLRGSRSPLPHVCARHVVAWYKARYGDRWREVFARRKSRTRPADPPWRVYYSRADGGYTLSVWVDGEPETAVRWDRRRRRWTARPLVFGTEAEAAAFAPHYVRYRYPLFAAAVRVARRAAWGGLAGPRRAFDSHARAA